MGFIERILLFSINFPRKNVTQHRLFKYNFNRSTMQIVATFSTTKVPNFVLFHSSTIKKNEQSVKRISSILSQENVDSKKDNIDENISSLQSLSKLDLTNANVIDTILKILEICKMNKGCKEFEKELFDFVGSCKFLEFYSSLDRKLPLMSANDLKLLLHCDILKISPSSSLMRKVYHLILEKFNEFTPGDKVRIYQKLNDYSYQQCHDCNNIRQVFKNYFFSREFKNYLNGGDFDNLTFFASNKKLPLNIRIKIFTQLSKRFFEIENRLDFLRANRLITAVSETPQLRSYFKPAMIDALKPKLYTVESSHPISIFIKNYRELLFYNYASYDEDFLNTLIDKFIKLNNNFPITASVIYNLHRIEHINLKLIEYFEKNFVKSVKANENVSFFNVARNLSDVYYHPFGYCGDDSVHKECMDLLDTYDMDTEDLRKYIKWCLCLTVLGSKRKIELLNKLFDYINRTVVTESSAGRVLSQMEDVLTLNSFARRYFPNDVVQLAPENLQVFFEALGVEELVQTSLSGFFEINTEVLHSCTCSTNQFINYAVVLDKENRPRNVNSVIRNGNTFAFVSIDSIEIQPSDKVIVYLIYRNMFPTQFRNSSVVPGRLQLYLESFNLSDQCKIVLIDGKKVFDKTQKLLYINSKIKESLQ